MPEDMARALRANGPMTVTIAGKECPVCPVGLQGLTEAERDCLDRYRRSYVKAYVESADLFPDGTARAEQAREDAARWDVDDLPPKMACDAESVVLTDPLRAWLREQYELDGMDDAKLRRLTAAALDNRSLSVKDYERMTGARPRSIKIPYVSWWITGCFDGMITFVWLAFRRYGVTRDQVAEYLSANTAKMAELSREIERLSTPSVGNG